MKLLNPIRIPTTINQDSDLANSVWKNGKLMIQRGNMYNTYFIGHETKDVIEMNELEGSEPTTKQVTFAFPIKVKKPVTYGDVINAAERQAYNLISDEAAISFSASLSRKYRENPQDEEVLEHDQFIAYVKKELAPIFK